MAHHTDLTIIILTYNSQFWLKKTLTTLKSEYLGKTKYQVKVIVIDNNSDDDSVKVIKQSYSWVELIESKENLGFAAGNNLALRDVKSRYVMLLNSDVEFGPNSNLDPIIDSMNKNKKIGIATPRLEFSDGSLDPACHRGEPTLWASFTYFSKIAKIFPNSEKFSQYHQTYKDMTVAHSIDACSGAAMIVRTDAMKKVGYLDERFFMYAEDIDWCRRFRDKNFQVIFYPTVRLTHHKYKSGLSSESVQLASKTSRHFYDTMLQYYDKHYQQQHPKFVRKIIKYYLAHKKGGI